MTRLASTTANTASGHCEKAAAAMLWKLVLSNEIAFLMGAHDARSAERAGFCRCDPRRSERISAVLSLRRFRQARGGRTPAV